MDNLIIYDTSNFVDFPIGGQITSIRSFLKYIAEYEIDLEKKILLVGVTNNESEVGAIQFVSIGDKQFRFLPILYRDCNYSNVKKSLRIEYLKALFKYKKLIPNSKNTIHYLHTPEAYIEIKLVHPRAKVVAFSHGNYFNMAYGFRFYNKNRFVIFMFNLFIAKMLKKLRYIFVLDDDSYNKYKSYNDNVLKVDNSIILPEIKTKREKICNPIRILFVGRLSRVKGIDKIIYAVKKMESATHLTIVGDGEIRDELVKQVIDLEIEDNVTFVGSVKPQDVMPYYVNNDILIMNSTIEGKPMTIIEAMCYGLPIITTNVGGIGDLVEFGKNACLTDGSVENICSAVFDIAKNYSFFSNESIIISKKYDYRNINKEIVLKLKGLI